MFYVLFIQKYRFIAVRRIPCFVCSCQMCTMVHTDGPLYNKESTDLGWPATHNGVSPFYSTLLVLEWGDQKKHRHSNQDTRPVSELWLLKGTVRWNLKSKVLSISRSLFFLCKCIALICTFILPSSRNSQKTIRRKRTRNIENFGPVTKK
jgi:hypothetical protein